MDIVFASLSKDDIYIFLALLSVYFILLTSIGTCLACCDHFTEFPSIAEVKKSKYTDISDIYIFCTLIIGLDVIGNYRNL